MKDSKKKKEKEENEEDEIILLSYPFFKEVKEGEK